MGNRVQKISARSTEQRSPAPSDFLCLNLGLTDDPPAQSGRNYMAGDEEPSSKISIVVIKFHTAEGLKSGHECEGTQSPPDRFVRNKTLTLFKTQYRSSSRLGLPLPARVPSPARCLPAELLPPIRTDDDG